MQGNECNEEVQVGGVGVCLGRYACHRSMGWVPVATFTFQRRRLQR